MTAVEQLEFLSGQPFGSFATIGPTGAPHQVNIGFTLDGADRVMMTSFTAAQKVKNLERSPKASLLVEVTAPYAEIRGVLLTGSIDVIHDREQVAHWYWRLKEHSDELLPPDNLPFVDHERIIPKRVLLALSVEHRVSWDHRKLGGVY
jgi:hypothetical protein